MVTNPHPKHRECSANREIILDAAAELLREFGYKKMTIDELARHAGLGKGTVYLYFQSKEDVALSYIDRQNIMLQDSLKQILQSDQPASNRLRAMLIQRVMFRFQSVQGHKQGIDDLLIDLRPQLFDRRSKYMEVEARILAEVLIEGRILGELIVDDPFQVAEAFVDATNSLLPHSLSPTQLGDERRLYERVSTLSDLLVRSVCRQAPTSARDSAQKNAGEPVTN